MIRVPVVNPDGSPAMPCIASRARRMVRDGKAMGKRNKLGIYYIQLVDEPSGREKQNISAGIDPGKYYSGIGLQSSKFTLFTAHLFLPFETVKKRMEQRRMMRRGRRGRRINRKVDFSLRAHRQKRFSNRRGNKLAPSIKANRLLEIRVVTELAKIYPIASIVYEYVKAKTLPGCAFSPVQVGQKWAIEQLSKIASTITKFGWQTSNLRKHLGLPKQKLNKKEAQRIRADRRLNDDWRCFASRPATHAVDGITLAASQFIDYLPFENQYGHGHCWQGRVEITNAPFFVIRRPPISRRQLHLMLPSKGGNRRKYGGTTTRHNVRKGDYVEAQKAGITYRGWCSGDTAKQISVSDSSWKRIGQFTASKVKLLQRSTGLICKRGNDFSVAV